jgi:hypothetical protein
MKQCPSELLARPLPFLDTRLSAVVALGALTRSQPAGGSADPAKAERGHSCGHCGTARHCGRPQRWAHLWSTNIQPYFVILFCLVSFACRR